MGIRRYTNRDRAAKSLEEDLAESGHDVTDADRSIIAGMTALQIEAVGRWTSSVWQDGFQRGERQPKTRDDDEYTPCDHVFSGCFAPAGITDGGGTVLEVRTKNRVRQCKECGDNCCDACADTVGKRRLCPTCMVELGV